MQLFTVSFIQSYVVMHRIIRAFLIEEQKIVKKVCWVTCLSMAGLHLLFCSCHTVISNAVQL